MKQEITLPILFSGITRQRKLKFNLLHCPFCFTSFFTGTRIGPTKITFIYRISGRWFYITSFKTKKTVK